MKEKLPVNHFVVVGAWNKAIFSPEWMIENIISEYQNPKIEIPVGLDSSFKFTTNDFSFVILGNRLEISSQTLSEESFIKIIEIARKVFRLLPHTPINAIGLNFVFTCNESELEENFHFSFHDEEALLSNINKELTAKAIKRIFKINDKSLLTLSITKTNQIFEFDFNFNYNVSKIEEAIINIFEDSNEIIKDKRSKAIEILNNVYNLTLEV